jgi:hypothetical protein
MDKVEVKDVVVNFLTALDSDSKISVPVDPVVLALLKELLKQSAGPVSKTVNSIVSDGVLDTKDIPKIVLLVTQLKNAEFPTISLDSFVSLVTLLVNALIDLEFVKVADKTRILETLDDSLALLKITVAGVESVGLTRCC